MTRSVYFSHALLADGWARSVRVDISAAGTIETVCAGAAVPPGETRLGPVIAGIPNAHSHAFQRVMAGLTEHRVSGRDSFWSWRETMYRFAQAIQPDDLRAIAAQLYVEMIKSGYTCVAEFHYLHHAADGAEYTPVERMSTVVMEAAVQAGIGLTLLPVAYQRGGFDGSALSNRQRRFGCDTDRFLRLIGQLSLDPGQPHVLGVALHSLRAVSPDAIADIVSQIDGPVHIHVAEQPDEVAQCLKATGQRPVEWLLDQQPIDQRWSIVHATHMTAGESRALATSGAVAVLCPTTEANLGDGIFGLARYVADGGVLAIGSDSHISIDPREELRWLEYGQRLTDLSRNVLVDDHQPHSGRALLDCCLAGGRQALGQPVGQIAAGARADLVVLDDNVPALAHTPIDQLLDSWIFCGTAAPPRHVMVAGQWQVRDGRHRNEETIGRAYAAVARRLRTALPA